MKDLTHPRRMYLKALLFLIIAVCCSTLLLLQNPSLRTGALIGLLAWASSRAYYFLFYVIQNYIDGDYRYAGILSCLKYMMSARGKSTQSLGLTRSCCHRQGGAEVSLVNQGPICHIKQSRMNP